MVGYTDSTGSHDHQICVCRGSVLTPSPVRLLIAGRRRQPYRTSGMGPANPIASNSTAEGKAQNRRVEITLVPLQ